MQMGKSRLEAAYDGTTEVWGAVLASTLTTAAVFIPIMFIEEQTGQLFRDIAIAISVLRHTESSCFHNRHTVRVFEVPLSGGRGIP